MGAGGESGALEEDLEGQALWGGVGLGRPDQRWGLDLVVGGRGSRRPPKGKCWRLGSVPIPPGVSHRQLEGWRGFNWAGRQTGDSRGTRIQVEAERKERKGLEGRGGGPQACRAAASAWVSPHTGPAGGLLSLFLIKAEEEGEKTRPSASQFQN